MSPRKKGKLGGPRQKVQPGQSPGTLTIDPNAPAPIIEVLAYNPEPESGKILDKTGVHPGELKAILSQWTMVWVNVVGLGDLDVLLGLQKIFGLHGLALEDVLDVNQRPKVEPYQDHLFIEANLVFLKEMLETEQISLFLGERYVLTFQQRPVECFNAVRDRLRKGKGRIRSAGADYLAYTLLDAIVDHHFPVLEALGETLERLEDEVLERPDKSTIARIHLVKRELLALRRAVWPMRELVNALMRDEFPMIQAETRLYLRDCYDHAIQIIDLIENYREVASGLIDVYLSSVSNRMNDVMKVLTLIATIFIPLGFIAGLYGMNFDHAVSRWNMPELYLPYGYPMALAIMAGVAIIMLIFFYRKGWIGETKSEKEFRKSGKG